MNQKKISTEDEKKKAENEKQKNKQQEIAEKRKESGLSLVKLYLDQDTINILSKLCKNSGYTSVKPKDPNRLNNFSKVLSYYLKEWTDKEDQNEITEKDRNKAKINIESYRIEQIINYRYSILNNKKDLGKIVSFLNCNNYPTFRQIYNSNTNLQSGKWTKTELEKYLEE